MSNAKKEFISTFLRFSWGPIVGSLFSFISVPIVTRVIMPEEFGKAALFNTILMFTNIFILLGLDQAFVRDYYRLKNNKSFLFNVLFPSFVTLFVIEISLFLVWEQLSVFLFNQVETSLIIPLATLLPTMLYTRYCELLLRVNDCGHQYSMLNFVNKVISFTSLLILLRIFRSFHAIIYSLFITNLLSAVLYGFLTRKFWIIQLEIDKRLIINLLKYSIPLMPSSLLAWGLSSMDKVLLRVYSGFNDLGIYNSASKIAGIFLVLQVAFASFWGPTAYKWFETKVSTNRFEVVSNVMLSLLMLLISGIILSRNLIILILGPSYESALNLIPLLTLVPIIYTLMTINSLGITFMRKTYWTLIISIFAVIVNLIGNMILIPIYGAMGAATATVGAYLLYFIVNYFISGLLWEFLSVIPFIVNFLLLTASYVSIFVNNSVVLLWACIISILFNILIIISNVNSVYKG